MLLSTVLREFQSVPKAHSQLVLIAVFSSMVRHLMFAILLTHAGNSELHITNDELPGATKITFRVGGEDVIVFNEDNRFTVESVLREKNETYGRF